MSLIEQSCEMSRVWNSVKNKPFYHSDQLYLESKLQPVHLETIVKVETPKPEQVEYIPPPLKPVEESNIEDSTTTEIRGTLPKGWSTEDKSKELKKFLKTLRMKNTKLINKKRLQMKLLYVEQN